MVFWHFWVCCKIGSSIKIKYKKILMESRWLLFPGQTVENTKVSERSHALHITQKNWTNITGHLDRKKNIQEAIDKELSWKRYLKDGSRSMMDNWENSLEVSWWIWEGIRIDLGKREIYLFKIIEWNLFVYIFSIRYDWIIIINFLNVNTSEIN